MLYVGRLNSVFWRGAASISQPDAPCSGLKKTQNRHKPGARYPNKARTSSQSAQNPSQIGQPQRESFQFEQTAIETSQKITYQQWISQMGIQPQNASLVRQTQPKKDNGPHPYNVDISMADQSKRHPVFPVCKNQNQYQKSAIPIRISTTSKHHPHYPVFHSRTPRVSRFPFGMSGSA